MEFSEREKILRRITSKKAYSTIKFDSQEIDVVFSDPSLELLTEADWIYKRTFDRESGNTDFITVEETEKILSQEGKWGILQKAELEGIQLDIKQLHEKLPSLQFMKAQQRAVKKTIEEGEKKLYSLIFRKNQYYHLTLEFKCNQDKRRFIISKICKILSNPANYSNLLENNRFLDVLSVYYFEDNAVSLTKIRELARTDPWRLYWTASKDSNTPLFPHSCIEMSDWQYMLVSWSKIYDFAYQSPDRPNNSVIEDDILFDNWYRQEAEKLNKNNQVNNGQSFNNGIGHQEIFIVADAEGAKEVMEMNNPVGLNRIKTINKLVAEKGEIQEANLPDTQMQLRMAANNAKLPN